MAFVYILRGTTGRFYIGATRDLEQRLIEHQKGGVYTTKRLGLPLELVVFQKCEDFKTAGELERKLKSWKNAKKAIEYLKGG